MRETKHFVLLGPLGGQVGQSCHSDAMTQAALPIGIAFGSRVFVCENLKEYEDLILQLDATFSDLEAARRKGYLARDMPLLHKAADGIRAKRATMKRGRNEEKQ